MISLAERSVDGQKGLFSCVYTCIEDGDVLLPHEINS